MALGNLFRKYVPGLYETYVRSARSRDKARMIGRVQRIVSTVHEPERLDDERQFAALQARNLPQPGSYNYDLASLWRRAATRVISLLDKNVANGDALTILDVGCGDGMTGYCLSDLGHQMSLTDASDWRHPKAGALPFLSQDVCSGLAYSENSFDLITSFNSFEHFPDPKGALAELVRVCKPGGKIYLDFGPLYPSPWGLHAWSLRFPYPQFLF